MRGVRRLRILGLVLAIKGLVATRLGLGSFVATRTACLTTLDLLAGVSCDAVVVLRLILILHGIQEIQLIGSEGEGISLGGFVSI